VPITDYAFWRSWDVDKGFLRGIAVDASGRVYATASPAVLKFTAQGGLIDSWGGEGSGDGQFDVPCGIAVDRAAPAPGRVYVVDTYNERIQAFTESGDFDFAWGGFGGGDGEFEEACGIAVDTMRNIYVVDWGLGNHRVQKFTRRGGFIASWGGFGNGNGEFEFPRGIAIHGSKVYVADGSNDRIQQFSLSGSFQLKWGGTGGGNGKFHNPFDVAVDQAGSVYVADRLNHRVQKFLDGSYVTQFGGIGSGAGELNEPHALAVDGKGWVYVADSGHARIVAFKPA
jgi:DNA-binding beta-propeller fold protein YncE